MKFVQLRPYARLADVCLVIKFYQINGHNFIAGLNYRECLVTEAT